MEEERLKKLCQKFDRRAYTLPPATALRRKRRRPSFQIITRNFCPGRHQWKALKGIDEYEEARFKISQRR